MPEFIKSTNGYDLAFSRTAGKNPTVIFLPGFMSDMAGTKAVFLEEACRAREIGYVRFDYGGHGQSGSVFRDGTISAWAQDALDVIDRVAGGDVILAGSSMGGWIAMLCALKRPDRVRGLIGVAAAPDFTTWIERDLTDENRDDLARQGFFEEPSPTPGEPYVFTRAFLDDGRKNAVLGGRIDLDIPVRLVQGRADAEVPPETATHIQKALKTRDCQVFMVPDGDHRLSRPEDLTLLERVMVELHAKF
jgi:pimeloyl-ACP methyl ester carboxylesterase